ncbi:ABC transporter substrate-binding protein [Thermobrachium celere]|uniref:Hypothetical sugar-binding protein n=1 Tax=Thermobrachium celere DSM 8682 TaxID=941824 RepID=R7RR51_9CLOT|nr:ABC transporter substrate-binding protein [Thermobrachium celere]CDF57740.1 hypothetical sugar-binding protein [Thermobrachium celere DSM 8682]
MNKNKKKLFIYSILTIFLLIVSLFYKINLKKIDELKVEEDLKEKVIIRLWMKSSIITPTRGYQIEKFNKTNSDNIYIVYNDYKEDYYNLLRVALATDKGPDIFEYGFTSLIKNNQIATLDDIGFDYSNIDNSSVVRYMDKNIGVKLTETNVKLIWNKDIFKKAGINPDQPPKTIYELINYAKIIKRKFPDIIPFAFPISEYKDIKISIGEACVSNNNIYTSFWDYKRGIYDFKYAEDLLKSYHEMYLLGLIDKDFDKKSKNQLRSEFYQGKIAILISTFEDKSYFSNILPLSFDIGISDVFKIRDTDIKEYYYVDNDKFFVINKKSIEDPKKKIAIKKVYEFLLSEETNREILSTRNALPLNIKDYNVKNDIYKEYNHVVNFKNENYDPTIFLSRNSSYEINQIIGAIKGDIKVEQAIKNLNDQYFGYIKFATEKEKFNLSFYKK